MPGFLLLLPCCLRRPQIWDLQEGLLFYTLHGHEGAATGVSFAPDGTQFASCGADQQVRCGKGHSGWAGLPSGYAVCGRLYSFTAGRRQQDTPSFPQQVMVWRTNFDRCLAEFGATVAVAGELDAPTERAVRQKLAQLRGPSQQQQPAGAKPPAAACSGAAAGTAGTKLARQQGQQAAGGMIKAVPPAPPAPAAAGQSVGHEGMSRGGRLDRSGGDGSHAVFESLSLNAADLPEGLAATLLHITTQLDILTQAGSARRRDADVPCSRRQLRLLGHTQAAGSPAVTSSHHVLCRPWA